MDTSQPATPKPNIHRLIELQQLLLSFGAIERMVYIPPGLETKENNVEHSFSLAMLAWFLAPHFPALDSGKLITLSLAHDLFEVYCGDTFLFDAQATPGQKERETAAIARFKEEWADFAPMHLAIEEYEAAKSPEARFVMALDRLQSAMMDYLNQGQTWHELGITLAAFVAAKDKKMPVSP